MREEFAVKDPVTKDVFREVARELNRWLEDVKDEDDMASDSASKLVTQQSIKAYADTLVAAIPQWHKIADPTTGWKASKTSGWTADSFSGGLEVNFDAEVPIGTKAIRCMVIQLATQSIVYYRKSGDTNISNTPHVAEERSHRIMGSDDDLAQAVLWLSTDYKVQFAVTHVDTDLNIAYPIEYYK